MIDINTKGVSNRVATLIGTLIGVVLLSFIMALPIKWLWNWIVPSIWALPTISWLQAWGLSVLSSLLLKPSGAKAQKKDSLAGQTAKRFGKISL